MAYGYRRYGGYRRRGFGGRRVVYNFATRKAFAAGARKGARMGGRRRFY